MSAQPPSENSSPPRLTLDTNLLLELWKQHEKKGHVEALIQLAEQGRVQLAVTARVREDVPEEPLASRLDELPTLGIAETASVARLDFWVLGRDRLGADDFVEFEAELAASVEPGRKPDWRDLDHLHAHMLEGRDVFLTWDRGILALADALMSRFGITVMKPETFLDGTTSTFSSR